MKTFRVRIKEGKLKGMVFQIVDPHAAYNATKPDFNLVYKAAKEVDPGFVGASNKWEVID